ncbi:MAG UNVERIFIED_CONTAM: PfkB family carbohydrate kinase [Planctomycetaceae bacterium]
MRDSRQRGEFNCAANLADCFQLKTGIASAMVDYPIGDLINERVRAMGVRPFYKRFTHDGVRGPNMATVYSDQGHGVRGPVVFYNRSNEAAGLLKPGDFNWKEIFAGGVRWFHSGGIFAALSSTTPELIIEAMQAARAAGAVTSFDLNYRAKLWKVSGGLDKAQETLNRIVEHVDVLVGNEEDLQKGLGLKGQDVESHSKLDPSAFFGMMEEVASKLPNVKAVATTLREVHSTNRHSWSAVLWMEGKTYQAKTIELDVIDRIGGGDGFASGLFYGLLKRRPSDCPQSRLGSRSPACNLPGRYHHGDHQRSGSCRLWRFGSRAALVTPASLPPVSLIVSSSPSLSCGYLINVKSQYRFDRSGRHGSESGHEHGQQRVLGWCLQSHHRDHS